VVGTLLSLFAGGFEGAKCLNRPGVIFLEYDRLPSPVEAECRGRDDLQGIARLAYARAMEDMVRYSGFVAEDVDGAFISRGIPPAHRVCVVDGTCFAFFCLCGLVTWVFPPSSLHAMRHGRVGKAGLIGEIGPLWFFIYPILFWIVYAAIFGVESSAL
jgi:hypothetical protein